MSSLPCVITPKLAVAWLALAQICVAQRPTDSSVTELVRTEHHVPRPDGDALTLIPTGTARRASTRPSAAREVRTARKQLSPVRATGSDATRDGTGNMPASVSQVNQYGEMPLEVATIVPASGIPGSDNPISTWNAEIECGDPVRDSMNECGVTSTWYAGLEAAVLEPRFGNSTAFTVMDSDGQNYENYTDSTFDYGLEFSPRAFIGLDFSDGLGFRTTWWQLDQSAEAVAQPPANGFGQITSPTFSDLDIFATVPSETFTASAGINAYTLDLEITDNLDYSSWAIGVTGGLRLARVEQSYRAQITDSSDDAISRIYFRHEIEGLGATISLCGQAPLSERVSLFCRGRGSLLFAKTNSQLNGVEDLDLTTPFTTTKNTSGNDLLPIAELQLGLRWSGKQKREQRWQPFATVALETQQWFGAGNATSEVGDVGFSGFTVGAGLLR